MEIGGRGDDKGEGEMRKEKGRKVVEKGEGEKSR